MTPTPPDHFVPPEDQTGDCYQAAFNAVHDFPDTDDPILVHGLVTGQGPIEGIRHGHAWVELYGGDVVYDCSNGKDVTLPGYLYRRLGRINDEDCQRYTPRQARTCAIDTQHYGPWHGAACLGDPCPDCERRDPT